eukprot:TRINITY_DN5581_c0_g1_i2.p1 TRINITY_DN5581_c0_g1~~TRINITY_DN5581_c0_g1_i2.p1  ORF type:complete len:427 (-),score=70.22 TRINITY_DN5581_c0_g1_i2:284-1564(-)
MFRIGPFLNMNRNVIVAGSSLISLFTSESAAASNFRGINFSTEKAQKVVMCHFPPGNPDNFHTISVNENAVRAHLAHGDILGPCSKVCNDPQLFSPIVYEFTGGMQSYTVPKSCVTSIDVALCGAQGSVNSMSAAYPGGLGASASGTLSVSPGQVIHVFVGGQQGFNGGGAGGLTGCSQAKGGHGGGASDLRVGGTDLSSRVIVAAGGGGAGGDRKYACGPGSGGGGGGGWYGGGGGASYKGFGGLGGSQSAGGAGGAPDDCGGDVCPGAQPGGSGSFGSGGDGGSAPTNNQFDTNFGPPGGAGGQFIGNTGGSGSPYWRGGGGGGGSSYVDGPGVTNGVAETASADCAGDGQVIIAPSAAISRRLMHRAKHGQREKAKEHHIVQASSNCTCPVSPHKDGTLLCDPVPERPSCRAQCEAYAAEHPM